MNRSEFLEKLQNALENDLHGQIVQEHVNYYNNYIIEETRKGKAEESVIEELGDPWMIARTLIEAAENSDTEQGKSAYETEYRRETSRSGQSAGNKRVYSFGGQSWWKTLVFILGIIGVLALVIAVIGGLFALVAPIILPVIVIVFVLRLFSQGRR